MCLLLFVFCVHFCSLECALVMCGVCCRQYDGVAVTVFERDERLGGRVRSVSIGGSEFEAGAAMAITQVCRCRRTAAAAHIRESGSP